MVSYVQERKEQLRRAKACQVHPTSGHMGVKKTVARIKGRFAWKGIIKDVQRLISVRQHFTCIYHSKVTKSRGTETFELFCQYRLPEPGRMIQCDHCQEWYHSECVTVPESIWKAKKCQVVLQDLQVKNCYRNDSSKYNLEQEIVLCIGHHAYVMSLMWDFHL